MRFSHLTGGLRRTAEREKLTLLSNVRGQEGVEIKMEEQKIALPDQKSSKLACSTSESDV